MTRKKTKLFMTKEYSNKDIFNKIGIIDTKIDGFIERNGEQHESIIKHQIETNGRVKLNKWIGTTALTLVVSIVTIIIIYIAGG